MVTHKFLYEERPEKEKIVPSVPEIPDKIAPSGVSAARPSSANFDAILHPKGSTRFRRPSLSREVSLQSGKSDISRRSSVASSESIEIRRSPSPGMIPEYNGADEEEENNNTSGAVAEQAESGAEEEEEDLLGFNYGLVWLGVITIFISVLSDAISGSIQNAAESAKISGIFIAGIILPIVGNAAEHAGAVMFAMKGKLDLSLGVAIGSSTQIALCVLPLIVLIGWALGKDMDLNFGAYEASTMFLSVVAVTFAIKDGHSNWLLGVTLIAAYFVVSVGFYAHKNDSLD